MLARSLFKVLFNDGYCGTPYYGEVKHWKEACELAETTNKRDEIRRMIARNLARESKESESESEDFNDFL